MKFKCILSRVATARRNDSKYFEFDDDATERNDGTTVSTNHDGTERNETIYKGSRDGTERL